MGYASTIYNTVRFVVRAFQSLVVFLRALLGSWWHAGHVDAAPCHFILSLKHRVLDGGNAADDSDELPATLADFVVRQLRRSGFLVEVDTSLDEDKFSDGDDTDDGEGDSDGRGRAEGPPTTRNRARPVMILQRTFLD